MEAEKVVDWKERAEIENKQLNLECIHYNLID
jgi:hypothetical protein